MKKLFLLAVIISVFLTLNPITSLGQNQMELWGMTTEGGIDGGVIFKTNGNGNNQQVQYTFPVENSGKRPIYTHLCQASNGKLYGMTSAGGANDLGVIFEYDPATSTYTKKLDFYGTTAKLPYGSLMMASNGKLYGMTSAGGAFGYGVIFEYDPVSSAFAIKYSFTAIINGVKPQGTLIQGPNGKFYGMTNEGGVNDKGVLFEFDLSTSTYIKKIDFDWATTGCFPSGSLVQTSNGKMYGMTYNGGSIGYGVLFEYDPTTSTFTKKVDFNGSADGGNPYGTLMLASNGKLYGMLTTGGLNNSGVLFEYNPTTSIFTKKFDFASAIDGIMPFGSLIQAGNGKIYGMTSAGGTLNLGILFEYDLTTSTCVKKVDFNGATLGSTPYGTLMKASSGNLYGMTGYGGTSGFGVLFEYNPTTSTYAKKIDFEKAPNGSKPITPLIQATNGKLYGTTYYGGTTAGGVLFEFSRETSTYTTILHFVGASNGSSPYGSLLQASNGKIYGTTNTGGANNGGVIFEFNPASSSYLKKFDFEVITSGRSPNGSLIQATNGKLYGMTERGGASDMGSLFEYDPNTDVFIKKINFTGTINGSYPKGSLVQASNGKIYGMTSEGGANNYGVLFEYDPITSTFTKKLDFAGITNGRNPYGSLTQASNGKLYGMTYRGGTNSYGVLFEFDPTTSTFTKKFDFNGSAKGAYPYGSLTMASNGKMYGMTNGGGANWMGVIFEYDLTTSTYTKTLDYNKTNGSSPIYSHLIEVCASPKFTTTIAYASVCVGGNTDLITVATGNGLTYKWQVNTGSGFVNVVNNSTYSGATDDTLHITAVTALMNSYQYRCLATSTCPVTSITSDTATLNVIPLPQDLANTDGLVAYFPFNNNGNDESGNGNNGTLYGATSTADRNSLPNSAYSFNGVGNYVAIDGAVPTSLQIQNEISISAWVYITQYPATNGFWNIAGSGSDASGFNGASILVAGKRFPEDSKSAPGNLTFRIGNGSLYETKTTSVVPLNQWVHVVATRKANESGKIYFNGVLQSSSTNAWSGQIAYTGSQFMIGKQVDYSNRFFNGKIDEVRIYNRALDAPEVTNLYSGTPILVYADEDTICVNTSTNIKIVNSEPGVSYQLLKNGGTFGTPQAGNQNILTFNTGSLTALSQFRFLATNSSTSCSVTLDTTLKIVTNPLPTITAAVTPLSVCVSGPVQFSATTNMGTISWYDAATNGNVITNLNPTISSTTTYYCQGTSPQGCISPRTAVTATVNPAYSFAESHSICNGTTYNWHGTNYSAAGSFTKHYTTINGCDSNYTLNLSVKPVYSISESHNMCQGATYNWRGTNYTSTGTYTKNYTSSLGCDSIYTLNLTVNPVYAYSANQSICNGASYNWHGTNYTTSGTYTKTYISSLGCDSVYTLHLTINPKYAFTENQSICQGSNYHWHGADYSTSGTYTKTYTSSLGCDSVYTLHLTINPVYAFTEDHSMCQGSTYNWHGTDYSISGTYTKTYPSILGCDSVYNLQLTVNPISAFSETHYICEGETYHWQGSDYSNPDTYVLNYSSINGCDSNYTLTLAYYPNYSIIENKSLCRGDSYDWHGTSYTTAGTYYDSLQTINGCDSIHILELTMNDEVDVSVSSINTTITVDITADAYQWVDCNSAFAPVPGSTAQSFTPVINGNYAAIITRGSCTDTSACIQISSIGIAAEIMQGVDLFPNPVSNELIIKSKGFNGPLSFEILNSIGQVIVKGDFVDIISVNTGELAPGVYVVKLTSGKGVEYRKIIKE